MSRAVRSPFLVLAACIGALAGPPGIAPSAAQGVPSDCRQWQECQQLALAAEEGGDYARFHDLAWRAVQNGPRNDRDLMFLLARAQARSGRPHDALVMLQRLAQAGGKVDASGEAFARTRELPGWAAIAELLAAGGTSAPSAPSSSPTAAASARTLRPQPPVPSNSPSVAPPPAPTVRAPAVTAPAAPAALGGSTGRPSSSASRAPANATPATAVAGSAAPPMIAAVSPPLARTDAARFSAPRFPGGGFAFDAVSQRFVIGDASARKLVVVGVGGAEPTDMVRADSAGFEDVSTLEIDERRGDLWVAGAAGAVHRLQLVSGRPLKTYHPSGGSGAVDLVDLAVSPASGTVWGLDAIGRRLLALTRGAEQWEVATPIDVTAAVSVALQDDTTAFIAHASGLARIDLRAHTTSAVAAPDGLDLRGIARVRVFHGSLLAVQRTSAGDSWRLVRLILNGSRRVTSAAILDDMEGLQARGSEGRAPFIAIAGDELYYLVAGSGHSGENGGGTYVVRRLSLR